MHLFMIYIGGRTDRSLIELHDMRFVIAKSIEETYPILRQSWWGVPESLHLDAWGVVRSVDHHHIIPQSTPGTAAKRLYFLNMGGYSKQEFTELHKNLLIVATSESEAKERAKAQIQEWDLPHKDYCYNIETCFCVNKMAEAQDFYLHCEPTNQPYPFEFTCDYIPIG